jgi:PST family polysaccharide transporter
MGLVSTSRTALRTGLARNIGSLYVIQFVLYLVPLMTLPWLARVLGPSGLGILATAQAFGSCVTLLVEYGFSFSATQQAAIHRRSPERLSRLVAGVQGGKAVLSLAAFAAAFAAHFFIPAARGYDGVFAAAVAAAAGQGFGMTWYFLALERMPAMSAIESSLRVAAAAAIVLLVRSPRDLWKVFALQGAASWSAAFVGAWLARRDAPFRRPTAALIREALANGRAAVFFRVAETSYTSCNSLLLGFFFPAGVVGLFAGAEKIARGFLVALLDPMQRSIYPGVAQALADSRVAAARLVRTGAAVTVSLAALGSLAVFAAAPQVIRLLLGPGYEAAVPTLRILLVVPVAVAFKWSIGFNWMVPIGDSRTFNAVVAGSAALHLLAAFVFARAWGQVGMAAAVALTEVFIPLSVYVLLRRRDTDPFHLARQRTYPEFAYDSKTEVHCH